MSPERRSLISFLNLPSSFIGVLLTLSLALSLAPYFPGLDFGVFKIPELSPGQSQALKIIGPISFFSIILSLIPIFKKSIKINADAHPSESERFTEILNKDKKKIKGFWTEIIDKSLFHSGMTGDRSSLVVFIHGLRGSAIKTWGGLPKLVIDKTGSDFDILSFSYEKGAFHQADIETAATNLRKLLTETLANYMHLIFIAEDVGGLILKELFYEDSNVLSKKKSNSKLPAIVGRTREIINFSVPHSGIKKYLKSYLDVLRIINIISQPLLKLLKSINRQWSNLGKNELFNQVRYDRQYTTDLNGRFNSALKKISVSNLPTPRITDFVFDDNYSSQTDHHYQEVEKIAKYNFSSKTTNSSILQMIVNRVEPYIDNPLMAISYATVRRSRLLDENISLSSRESENNFVSKSDSIKELSSNYRSRTDVKGSQIDIYDALDKSFSSDNNTDLIVTGGAGVGKSVLLRTVAKNLSIKYLESRGTTPLCMLIPLQQVVFTNDELDSVNSNETGTIELKLLMDHWSSFGKIVLSDQYEEKACSSPSSKIDIDNWSNIIAKLNSSYLLESIYKRKTVLVFDAIDEWLVNNPNADTHFFLRIRQKLSSNYDKTQIVIGVRSTVPTINLLTTNSNTFEILPLAEKDAERLFPGTGKLFSKIEEDELRILMLTPLILGRIGPVIKSISVSEISTRIGILRTALKALVQSSQLPMLRLSNNESYHEDVWINALSVIAWIFYRSNKGVMNQQDLKEDAEVLKSNWNRNSVPFSEDMKSAFDLISDSKGMRAIRFKTVLTAVGSAGMRFLHREWQDSLVANYLALSVYGRMGSELEYRAFNKQIYRDASLLLAGIMNKQETAIDDRWIKDMYGERISSASPIALMSLAATLGNGPVPIMRSCYKFLAGAAIKNDYPEVSRLTVISSFGMRLLRNEKDDKNWDFLFEDSLKTLEQMAALDDSLSRRVSASMAWCYLMLLNIRFKNKKELKITPWPTLNATSKQGLRIAEQSECVWKVSKNKIEVTPPHRTFQIASVHYALVVKNIKDEEISLVHYLFLACAALQADAAVGEVYSLLKTVFSEESGLRERVDSFEVKEVREIFDSCYSVYEKRNVQD
ncbi:MAG: hypothetical protein ABJG47_13060 [Ekhidna sp.]